MKLLLFLALFTVACAQGPSPEAEVTLEPSLEPLPDFVQQTTMFQSEPAAVLAFQQQLASSPPCTLNVCFALDGSEAVGAFNFGQQKDFVKILSFALQFGSGLGAPSRIAAVQYGLVNSNISPLTDDFAAFRDALDANTFEGKAFSFMSAGIGYCVNELDGPEFAGDANVIVLMGDGKTSFTDLTMGPLSPAAIAEQWRNSAPNNLIAAVAVKPEAIPALEAIVGNPEAVFGIADWPALVFILGIVFLFLCAL